MTKLVRFPLEEGGSILVEVEEEQLSGPVPAASPGELAGEAKITFEKATAKLGPIARIVLDQVKDLGPQEVGVELGVKFSAEAGIILAKSASEGTCTVKLTWKKSS